MLSADPNGQNLAEKREIQRQSIGYLQHMVSRSILHELAHAVSKEPGTRKPTIIDQVTPSGRKAYGWRNLITLDAASAPTNAESYVYFAFWAGLADEGFTLFRLDESKKETKEYAADLEKVEKGKIWPYASGITSRMIGLVKFSA